MQKLLKAWTTGHGIADRLRPRGRYNATRVLGKVHKVSVLIPVL